MRFTLENDKISIAVHGEGGELKSLFDKGGSKEYLWQGEKQYWSDSAPNLFPYIARLTDETYTYKGNLFHMGIHGFIKDMELEGKKLKEELVFELKADDCTKQCYPFQFIYKIRYRLLGTSVIITYEVENIDNKNIYFGIGGHPGFQVPFIGDTVFEDYYLEFEGNKKPIRIRMSQDCFVLGEEPFEGLENRRLRLSHQLFDNDAVILKEMGKQVVLKTDKSDKSVTVTFPDMDYLGIWHKPNTKAPYICIEPWSSLPSRKGIIEDLEEQENLICLPAGEIYKNTWIITLDSREIVD